MVKSTRRKLTCSTSPTVKSSFLSNCAMHSVASDMCFVSCVNGMQTRIQRDKNEGETATCASSAAFETQRWRGDGQWARSGQEVRETVREAGRPGKPARREQDSIHTTWQSARVYAWHSGA